MSSSPGNETFQELENEKEEQRVRGCLNRDKVKLWEPPYTTSDGQKGENPNELVDKYTAELEMSAEHVSQILERLRSHAVEKLAARTKFQKTGVATLKAKLAGCVPQNARECAKNPGLAVEIDLKLSGLELKHVISERSGVEIERLKVISSGRVIEDGQQLLQQGIKNQAPLMVLCLTDSEVAARKEQDAAARLMKTKDAAQYLSTKEDGGEDDDSNYYLQVADQTGNKLNIPAEERTALVYAMTLHEKGRAAIRRKDYSEALLLLLEADGEFKRCNSEILTGVDNYALVCLDIVWCYLCLKSLRDLPDAEIRLKACDDCLRKSYGPNLERLVLVKGETGIERALFMRLHLLQAILAFHKNQTSEASLLLDRVEREMGELRVDESAMAQVMGMGFSDLEARLALRACNGSVSLAISHIMKKQEERKQRKEKEKEEKRLKRIARRLGKTADGKKVDVSTYESLISMGFTKGASAEALRQSNNAITLALQVLQENPDLLDLPDPDKDKVPITDDLIAQVSVMGFSTDSSRVALIKFNGDVPKAVDELLKVGGDVPAEWRDEAEASTSSDTASSAEASPTKSPEEREQERRAMEEIIPDIAEDEEAHLDFTLEEEEAFLQQYRALIAVSSK